MAFRLVRAFVCLLSSRGYLVRGDSMVPNVRPGDLVLVDRSAERRKRLRRGAVVVARDPADSDRDVLKRVVGLPGEEVAIVDGLLQVDGAPLSEPYLGGLPAALGLAEMRWNIGQDECLLMGDNRVRSTDSRQYGPVKLAMVRGSAWFRCWPLSRFGRLR